MKREKIFNKLVEMIEEQDDSLVVATKDFPLSRIKRPDFLTLSLEIDFEFKTMISQIKLDKCDTVNDLVLLIESEVK